MGMGRFNMFLSSNERSVVWQERLSLGKIVMGEV